MIIRKATPKDSESIAALLLQVMKSMVYRFIGEENEEKGTDFFYHFIQQKANQYSYQNCFVAEENDAIVGVVNIYDGTSLYELRQPILEYVHKINPYVHIEDETQGGEFYIDALSVSPSHQGKGIGTDLLRHVIKEFGRHHKQPLGLLVDKKNPKAKKLYLIMGFEIVREKILSGHEMEHLQLKI